MVFDFNKLLIDTTPAAMREGPELQPTKIADLLSFAMARSNDAKDPVKLWGWCVKLSKDGILDLDKSDKEMLENFVKTSPILIVMAKGQILEILEKGKEAK